MSTVIVSSNKIDTTHRKSTLIIKVYLKSLDIVKHDFEHFLQWRAPGPSPRRPLEVGQPKIIILDPSLLFGLGNKVRPLVCLRYSVFYTNGFTTAIFSK